MIFAILFMTPILVAAQLAMGWTGLMLAPVVFGITSRKPAIGPAVGIAGLLSACAAAFYRDQQSGFIVSKRMAGVFSLPMAWMIYIPMGLIGFITAFLMFQVAATAVPRRRSESSPKSGLSLVKDR